MSSSKRGFDWWGFKVPFLWFVVSCFLVALLVILLRIARFDFVAG